MSVERSALSVERSAPRGAVFLSYASQDAEAAKRICEALRAAGIEVWFDQSELVGGDAWDQKIRGQVKSCALFVPVVSAATQARREGYFRIEWKLAAQRTHGFADGAPFLLPVVIDATKDGEALVPEEFRAVQWTRLPGGEAAEKLGARVKALLAEEGGDAAPKRPSSKARESPGRLGDTSLPAKPARRVPAAAWGVAVLASALAVAGFSWLKRSLDPAPKVGAGTRPPTTEKSATATAWPRDPELQRAMALVNGTEVKKTGVIAVPPSEAAQLAARALALFTKVGFTRDDLGAAEDFARRATEKEPDNAAAWGVRAGVQSGWIFRNWDFSEKRRQDTQAFANRALALDPWWDKIRHTPEFEASLTGAEAKARVEAGKK